METDTGHPLTLQTCPAHPEPQASSPADTAHGHSTTWTGLGYSEAQGLHGSLVHIQAKLHSKP